MSDHETWEALQDEEPVEKFVERLDSDFVKRLDSDAALEEKRAAWERLMDHAKIAGPNKHKAKEFLAEDDAEPTEADEPTTLVGTMTSETTAKIPYPIVSRGGIVYGSSAHGSVMGPGGWSTTPTRTSASAWAPPPTYPPTPEPKKTTLEQVPMPPKFTDKVLIAFLEEQEGMEDKLVWAAHLLAQHFEMRLEDGEIRLVMEFSLRDHYGNNPE